MEDVDRIKARKYEGLYCDEDYNPAHCAEKVRIGGGGTYSSTGVSFNERYRQCANRPGLGLGGLFCYRHEKNNPETNLDTPEDEG